MAAERLCRNAYSESSWLRLCCLFFEWNSLTPEVSRSLRCLSLQETLRAKQAMQQAGGDSAKSPIHGFIERTWGQRKARLDFLTAAGDEASRAATKASCSRPAHLRCYASNSRAQTASLCIVMVKAFYCRHSVRLIQSMGS